MDIWRGAVALIEYKGEDSVLLVASLPMNAESVLGVQKVILRRGQALYATCIASWLEKYFSVDAFFVTALDFLRLL